MKTYILDACALIAVLNKEKGAEPVKEILINANLMWWSKTNTWNFYGYDKY